MSIGLTYDLFQGSPGINAVVQSTENILWWGREHQVQYRAEMISGAARDAGNSTTDVLRQGLILGRITASGLLKEWNPTGTDGSEKVVGILMQDLKMTAATGSNVNKFAGPIMVGGPLKAAGVIVPGAASAGLSGSNYEYILRNQLAGTFQFDDGIIQTRSGAWKDVVSKDDDYTVLAADRDTLFVATKAGGAVTFTLPAPKKGLRFGFSASGAGGLVVASAAAGGLITLNDASADSIALTTASEKIGGMLEFIAIDTTSWLVVPHLFEAQTVTVVSA